MKWFILACLVTLFAAPSLTEPFGPDQGAHATVARGMLAGMMPYKDVWEVRPPASFFVYALAFRLLGETMLAVRIVDLLIALLTMWVVYRLGARLWGERAGLLASAFYGFTYFTYSFENKAQPDSWIALPLLTGIYLLCPQDDRPQDNRPQDNRLVSGRVLSGVCFAVAFLMRYTAFLALPALCLVQRQEDNDNAHKGLGYSARRCARSALWVGLGFAIGAGACLVYFWAGGALAEFHYVEFVFARVYVAYAFRSIKSFLEGVINETHHLFARHLALWMAALVAVYFDLYHNRLRSSLPVIVATVMMILSVYVQGKFYWFHWLPVIPFMALLAGHGVDEVDALFQRRAQGSRFVWRVRAFSLLLAVALSMQVWQYLWGVAISLRGREAHYARFGYGSSGLSYLADKEAADWVQQHTDPQDKILVWGTDALVYFLAKRHPSTRFIQNWPLVRPYAPAHWKEEFRRACEANPPPVILVQRAPSLPDEWQDALKELLRLAPSLRGQYDEVVRLKDYTVYQRK